MYRYETYTGIDGLSFLHANKQAICYLNGHHEGLTNTDRSCLVDRLMIQLYNLRETRKMVLHWLHVDSIAWQGVGHREKGRKKYRHVLTDCAEACTFWARRTDVYVWNTEKVMFEQGGWITK